MLTNSQKQSGEAKNISNLLLLIQSNQTKTEEKYKRLQKTLNYTIKELKAVSERLKTLEAIE